IPERRVAVRGTADVHQDGAATTRRLATGVVGGDGVLSGDAARRLRLCPCAHAPGAATRFDPHSPCRHDCRVPAAAAGDRKRLGEATNGPGTLVVAYTVCRLDRIAFFRAGRQRSPAAGMVRTH